jgi:hypothetical protein
LVWRRARGSRPGGVAAWRVGRRRKNGEEKRRRKRKKAEKRKEKVKRKNEIRKRKIREEK